MCATIGVTGHLYLLSEAELKSIPDTLPTLAVVQETSRAFIQDFEPSPSTLPLLAESTPAPAVVVQTPVASVPRTPTARPVVSVTTIPTAPAPSLLVRESFSTTTSQRVIASLSIEDAVPARGKFVAADLVHMRLVLYKDGDIVADYPILNKGKPGTPDETPTGIYTVLTKEWDHFNGGQKVHLPWAMQFYANYFIHGWPYYDDGHAVDPNFSGGCIRLSTSDAEKVYGFISLGTKLFVYDAPLRAAPTRSLVLSSVSAPSVSAGSYLVADADTGDVFLERNAANPRPIASVTKLMTALVANETIMSYKKLTVARSELLHTGGGASAAWETFLVGDLFYPLLMESSNVVANSLAKYYGNAGFVGWMNATAKSLDMSSTHFADVTGVSAGTVSTPDDLYRLATYIANKKSFIFDITRTPTKELIAESGTTYRIDNANAFSNSSNFLGGKEGKTVAAGDTMVSLFSVPLGGVTRRVAIIVLKSKDYAADTAKLNEWFVQSARRGSALSGAACVSCATPPAYRKIR